MFIWQCAFNYGIINIINMLNKIIFFSTIILFCCLSFANPSLAKDNATVLTIIGDGSSTDANSEIVRWGQKIASSITHYPQKCPYANPPAYYYNVLNANISNGNYSAFKRPTGSICGLGVSTYLCTYLIADSLHLARKKTNISVGRDYNVLTMIRDWDNNPGWKVLKGNDRTTVSQIRPGDAVFLISNDFSHHHVEMITDVKINPTSGNGSIDIIQANGYSTSKYFFVRNWRVILISDTFDIIQFGHIP